jgi:hypothetical protein
VYALSCGSIPFVDFFKIKWKEETFSLAKMAV